MIYAGFRVSSTLLFGVCVAVLAAIFSSGAVGVSAERGRSQEHGHGHALHVSASKGNDANACTANAPCRTISHAVSVASSGDRIVVKSGTYAEGVMITREVSLEADHGVKIDATGQVNGITLSGPGSAGSTVSGFDVENAIGEGILAQSTSSVTIRDNQLSHNDLGANTTATPECAPQGSVPGDCGEALHLMSVTDSHVRENDIEHNVGGILITDELGPSHGNVIADNIASNNAEDCGITLPSHNGAAVANPAMGGVYNNVIVHNVSENNGGAGVGMFAPFPGTASYNNLVVGNTLTGNGEAGVAVHSHAPGQNVSGNVIIDNHISGNGVDPDAGSGHPTGIALFSAVDATNEVVQANHIDDEFWGIFVAGPVSVTGITSNKFGASVTNPTN